MAISDVLFLAVEQIREQLRQSDTELERLREQGVEGAQNAGLRADIYVVVDEMERLARRLLTDAVGPRAEVQ